MRYRVQKELEVLWKLFFQRQCVKRRQRVTWRKGTWSGKDLWPTNPFQFKKDEGTRIQVLLHPRLASGYWQVPDSVEKTAFITHQGLYEFRVLRGPKPEDEVPVYLDYILKNIFY